MRVSLEQVDRRRQWRWPADGAICQSAISIDALLGHNTSASAHYDGTHFAANFGATTVISQSGTTRAVDPTRLDMSENAVTPGHV